VPMDNFGAGSDRLNCHPADEADVFFGGEIRDGVAGPRGSLGIFWWGEGVTSQVLRRAKGSLGRLLGRARGHLGAFQQTEVYASGRAI
jgi:hypothetical protein